MQEEVIQDLVQKVQALTEVVEGQRVEVEGLRIIQQRQRGDVRTVRAEGKTYNSLTTEAIEALQDQITERLDLVHTRIDDLVDEVTGIKTDTQLILEILRSNVKRAIDDPNTDE